MLKNLTHKMSVLTAKAGRSIKHKVNAMRNHEELRDMIVEMKSIPKAIHRAVKYYNLAIVELVGFSTIHANCPTSVHTAFLTQHEELLKEVDKISERGVAIVTHLEEVLEKEKALSSAAKAAAKDKLDEATRKTLQDLEKKLEEELIALTAVKMREVLKEYGLMQMELHDAITRASVHQAELVNASFKEDPPAHATYEELWDESRPAVGGPVAKPTAGEKRAPWEDLATLSRPVDGDTRIKYAKLWNEALRDILKPVREGNAQWRVLATIKIKFAKFFNDWVAADEDNAPYKQAAELLRESENTFAEKILGTYQSDCETAVRLIEPHYAVVPVKNQNTGNPDKALVAQRPAAFKGAVLSAINASATIASSAKAEVLSYGTAAMPTIP